MADTKVKAERRQITGKQVKQLRRDGVIPANIYGHRKESVAVQVPRDALAQVIKKAGSSAIIDVDLEGEARPRPALIKFIQRNPVTDELLHVDFYQVSMTEKMTVDVPLVLVGDPPAVKDFQGVLIQALDTLSIRCLPGNLPPQIEADISGLVELEQSVHVSDLQVPDDVEVLTDAESMVARVETPRIAAEIEAEEAAAAEEAAEAAAEAGEVEGEEAAEGAPEGGEAAGGEQGESPEG